MKGLLLVCVVLGSLTAVASSGAAKPQTINLLAIDSSFVGTGGFDSFGNSPPRVGQGFVIATDFYRWNGSTRGTHAGTGNLVCTFTNINLAKNTGTDVCTGVASLPAGQVVISGLIAQSSRFDIPIVGGTGAYTGAKGYVRIKDIGGNNSNKSANTFVITG